MSKMSPLYCVMHRTPTVAKTKWRVTEMVEFYYAKEQ